MADIVTFSTGALVGDAIVFLGAWIAARRVYRRADKAHGEVCQCGHVSSTHDAQGCHDQVKRPSEWDGVGSTVGYEWVDCRCVCYVGPYSSYMPEVDAPAAKELGHG